MDIHLTEEEQVEAIKKWWKDNAKSVIGGILIGLAVIYGGRTWFEQKSNHVEQASATYQAMIQDMQQSNATNAAEKASLLLGQFSDTPYSTLAALTMAKIKVDENNLVGAKSHLRWALDHSDQADLKHIARLRLVRVLLSEGNIEDAMALIESVDFGKYAASYQELKGDALVAKGQNDLAIGAYTLALESLEPGSRLRSYIEIKLDNLGEKDIATGES